MAMNANLPCGPGIPLPKGPNDARYVENIMEHAFLSEVLQHCWFIRHHPVEVIRPDVDAGGYDLVLEAKRRVRHIQLKSRWQKAAGPKVLKIIGSWGGGVTGPVRLGYGKGVGVVRVGAEIDGVRLVDEVLALGAPHSLDGGSRAASH
jgi:hypothetical protein